MRNYMSLINLQSQPPVSRNDNVIKSSSSLAKNPTNLLLEDTMLLIISFRFEQFTLPVSNS